jgi:hypothetical protein
MTGGVGCQEAVFGRLDFEWEAGEEEDTARLESGGGTFVYLLGEGTIPGGERQFLDDFGQVHFYSWWSTRSSMKLARPLAWKSRRRASSS